jgi:hypothetical protein
MSRARRTRNRNGETGFTSFRRKDTNWSLRSEGGVRVGRHRDRRFPADAIYPNIRDPDTLFVPLLDAARYANKMLVRLTGLGEERGNAVTLSGMQLASSLLRGG